MNTNRLSAAVQDFCHDLWRLWYLRIFWGSFGYYFLLPVFLAVIALLLSGQVRAMGIREAFWQDDLLMSVVAGFSLGILWALVLVVGYLLLLQDIREENLALPRPSATEPPATGQPATDQSATAKNAASQTAAGQPATDQPATDQSATVQSATDQPATGQPTTATAVPWSSLTGYVVRVTLLAIVTFGCLFALIRISPWFTRTLGQHQEAKVDAEEQADDPRPAADLCNEPAGWHAPYTGALVIGSALGGAVLWVLLVGWASTWRFGWLNRFVGFVIGAFPARWGPGVMEFALIVFWVALLVLTGLEASIDRGPFLVLFGLGMLVIYVAIRSLLRRSKGESPVAFAVLLTVHTFLAYLGVTWLFSQWWAWGWLGMAAAACLLYAGGFAFFPQQMREWLNTLLLPPGITTAERAWRRASAAVAVLTLVYFVAVCLVPATRSAATFGCFFLFGLVGAYGVAVVLIRRWQYVPLVAMLFLAVFSGIQRYHYRFDGLDYDTLLDLGACADEHRDQEELDEHSREFAKFLEEEGYWTSYALAGGGDLDGSTRMQGIVESDRSRELQAKYYQRWGDMERGVRGGRPLLNDGERAARITPVHMPAADLRHLLADWSRIKPKPDLHPLVRIDELDFESEPVVVVAVSGGGLRAAAWAFAVLAQLELAHADSNVDFPRQVRIITGASGGMLGASYYVETLADRPLPVRDWDQRTKEERRKHLEQCYCKLVKDCLTPIMQQLVLGDVPSLFSPWPQQHDRGKMLEEAWSAHLDGKLDHTFSDFLEAEKARQRPFLVFTPMLVEDGRRLLISNLDLRHVVVNEAQLAAQRELFSQEAYELFRMFPKAQQTFKLSTAVRMNASFPFFSPAVSLPTVPQRRVVDAGYFDNYGVSLASSWLFSVSSNQALSRQRVTRSLVIQIRASVSHERRTLRKIDPAPVRYFGHAPEEISSPVEALLSSWDSSSSFRNDGQLSLLSNHVPNFTVRTFELGHPAPLTWQLGRQARSLIWQNARDDHKEILKELVDWSVEQPPLAQKL
ncbi:MAG: patatin-like phospholipase family protein [Gemmataceae bacterium]|nr:patatin-like phospholipase family protein [Gemmataceae bacterium]